MNKLSTLLTVQLQRKHSVLTSSGSSALIVALKAAGIPKGAEVIMPAICCPAVLVAIQFAGYIPVLSDVGLNDYCINSQLTSKEITDKTKAIVAVHAYGHYCQIDQLSKLAKANNLLLIEDACLAVGGTYKGMPLGSFGDISIISFGYDKLVSVNYGGALLTNNDEYAQNADKFIYENPFFNFDLTNGLDNRLLTLFAELPQAIYKRKENVLLCRELLDSAIVKKLPYHDDVIFWRYPILVKSNREQLINSAKQKGIVIPKHYLSLHHFYTGLYLENAELLSQRMINIFIRPDTPKKQLQITTQFINEFAYD
ncbi:DegT/DnrJ/EryC1/StrS family aminotransferase [Colwelliaceae bacterium 6441]